MDRLILFSSTKTGHLAHIFTTAVLGQVASQGLVPPDPTTIETYGRLIIQALVAIVTIWATVRKALQQPEAVVKVPAAAATVPAPTLPPADGQAE